MAEEANNFFLKFKHLWQAGMDASLVFECHAGKAWFNLRLHTPYEPPPQQHHQQPRRPTPSRLRRRARRAKARAAAAAANTAPETNPLGVHIAVQTDIPSIETADVAEQASVQVEAEYVYDVLCPDPEYDTAQHSVQECCVSAPYPDTVNIPQYDGLAQNSPSADQNQIPWSWSCKCCQFERFFSTEEKLRLHHNNYGHMLQYEECNICYPWHVWTSR